MQSHSQLQRKTDRARKGECTVMAKVLLIGFNLLILMGALVGLSIGIYSLVQLNAYKTMILGTHMYTSATYLLILASAVALLISFIGCLGALRESRCLLITFFIVLFIIFILLFVSGILAYVVRSEATSGLRSNMEQSLRERYGVQVMSGADSGQRLTNVAVTDAWDLLQKHMSCCGVGNFTVPREWEVWRASHWCSAPADEPHLMPRPPNTKQCVPNSCCGQMRLEDGGPGCDTDNIHPHGCYYSLYNYLHDNAAIIGGIGLGAATVPVIGMILVVTLYRQTS